MDAASLIPRPDAIPAPAVLFSFLSQATLVLHLLLMNTMLGGTIIALVSSLLPSGQTPSAGAGHDITHKLPFTIALTVNLGVPPLLFLQVIYGQFVYVSSVLMAGWWVSVFMLVMAAYYAAYIHDFKFQALGAGRNLILGLALACLLLTGFIFTNNMTLMLKPEAWRVYFANPGGWILNWGDPTLLPRYLHFVVASLAVGGLALALLGYWRTRQGRTDSQRLVSLGLSWFTWGTLTQLAAGLWFLLALPQEIMLLFLGGQGLATTVLWLGVAAALAALGMAMKGRVLGAAAGLVITVALMVVSRDNLRQAYLQPYFNLDSLTVLPQYSPALLFASSLVAGLLIIIWMLRLAARAGKGD